MKNVKALNRKELKSINGGEYTNCEVPLEYGVCKPGYTFCSNPYCCVQARKPYICIDY